ncbi:D-alanine--D-alanine ligase [bacterium 1XD42-54]|nr:D-alanine--D-alanine ligase [bacterium 1XD42-54]
MKIVVLAGGISTEREVSITSGTMVCKALREKGHQAVLVDVYCGVQGMPGNTVRTAETGEKVEAQSNSHTEGKEAADIWSAQRYDVDEAAAYMRGFNDKIPEMKKVRRQFFGPGVLELCQEAELVFMALHGEDGEGGTVQAFFDLMGIRYTGSGHLGSAVAMDKGLSRKLFAQDGIPTAKGIVLSRTQERLPALENGVGLPCVVKPCCGGSSVGVAIVHTQQEYSEALEMAFGYEEEVVVEQYIEGREFSVGVVEGKAYPVIEIAPLVGFYDYTNKYQAGSTIETCPAQLDEQTTARMQRYAEMAYHALKLQCYARMDFMMGKDGDLYCLEANTLPGMTPTSLLPQEAAALGMSFADLCELLIEVSMKHQS